MAPVIERGQRLVHRIRAKREAETINGVWSWTVGDDSDGEEVVRFAYKPKRRVRRQEPVPLVPPEAAIPPPPAPEDAIDSTSSSSSESDGISSDTSGDEDETTSALPSSSTSLESSTTTVSQSFTTLIPGGSGEALRGPDSVETASRTITSLTPILTVVEPETTFTSYSTFITVDEPSTTIASISSSTWDSSSATRAAQSSAVADADSSPTPEVIRVHHHPHGLSNHAIHGLIAFGALGGLMGVLAIAWFVWRRHRKRNGDHSEKSDEAFARPSRAAALLSRVPFLKNRFGNHTWFNIDEPYNKGNNNSSTTVFLEKSVSINSTSKPRLDSQFFAPNQVMGVAVRVQAGDQPPAVAQNVSSGFGHHVGASISSTDPQRSNTVRNKEPPFPTNPIKRASAISSLSSGFGDGDMFMPNGESTMERLPQPPPSAKFSDATSRRDTVYTEASEDQPPRFRNVNSWVRQQTGRVKRSQARTQADDAPPMPQMPAEEDYGMMLPDGEEPRRPQQQKQYSDFDLGFAK